MAYSREQLDKVHNFEWYGRDRLSAKESVLKYGIAVKCIVPKGVGLRESEYDCFVPDPDDEDCCIRIRTSNDELFQAVCSQTDVVAFLQSNGFFLEDFKNMDITDKLFYACNNYDIIAILSLNNPTGYLREEIDLP